MGLFKRKYKTPAGQLYTLFDDMASQPHLLIAGATGSGKSVVENGILYNLLHDGPATNQLILLDPKRTELSDYKSFPHCIKYATEPNDMINDLQLAMDITEQRYREMQKRHLRTWDGGHIYVIIDELAFLMADRAIRKYALPLLQRLGMIARASRVHMIACTQTIKADVLPTTLTCNFDSRVAMRTSTAQQSRMIIDRAGCETFPSPVMEHKALCFFRTGTETTLYNVPRYTEEQYNELIKWWTSRRCVA